MKIRPDCIRAEALTKRFVNHGEEAVAYENVSLSIQSGEFCAVVGPSGCGKTTLLRTMAGLETASSGLLEINVPARADSNTAISFVFQEGALFPWMNLQQNIAFLLHEKKLDRAEADQLAMSWLEKVGLEKFARYFPHQVSGGMRQRVAIARSFALEPALLLMDEPFVFTDDLTRTRLHGELEHLWSDAKNTVVFVTHDIEEAVLLADRVLVFSPHPGSITTDTKIELERPRDRSRLRENTRFIGLVKKITHLIHAAPV